MCELKPINTAPIRPGEHFGPCLFFGRTVDDDKERYAIGAWDGEDYVVAGVIFEPTHYALLPPRPVEKSVSDPLKEAVEEISNFARIRMRNFYSQGGPPPDV